jgi:protein-ribulosamine 3-kinase
MSQIPSEIAQSISAQLGKTVVKFALTGGGCINHGGKLETNNGAYFLKWNDREKYPGMFLAETKGLNLLEGTHSFRTPKIIATGSTENYQYLLLEFIENATRHKQFWSHFGASLAKLHLNSHESFGLDHDNFIGSLQQSNRSYKSWIEFYIYERLQPQVSMCESLGYMRPGDMKLFEGLYQRLADMVPNEKPALLHGDLWSGNLLVDDKGDSCLIDPAVYYGNREVDIAMTQLFGGFDSTYFNSYGEVFPLHPGFKKRLDIYKLYPLLVHTNLFGKSYWLQVVSILKQFV